MPTQPPETMSDKRRPAFDGIAAMRLLWKRWQATSVTARSHFVVWLVVVVAFLDVSNNLQDNIRHWSVVQAPSWVGQWPGTKPLDLQKPVCDLDTRLIHDGLLRAPRFRDTLRWWTGPWVGQIPFYRPLTSWLFWIEWKAFGDYEARWHLIANLMHLWAVGQFVWLACDLFRYFRLPWPRLGALLAGVAFVNGIYALPVQGAIALETFGLWKNQPDSLGLALFCWSLRLYLRRIREEETGPPIEISQRNRTRSRLLRGAPLAVYLLVCATKEAGIFLPLLLPFLEARCLQEKGPERGRALRRLVPMLAALPLFFVFRALCLHDAVGFRYGTGQAWAHLLADNLAGRFSQVLVEKQWLPALISVGLLALLARLDYARRRIPPFSPRQNWVAFGVGSVGIIMAAAMTISTEETGIVRLATVILMLFIPIVTNAIAGMTLFGIAVGLLLPNRPFLGLFAYAWAMLALGLTLFSPTMLHRFYLVNAGFALLMGGGWALGLERLFAKKAEYVPYSAFLANPHNAASEGRSAEG